MLPPSTASINSEDSLMRHNAFLAFHLSRPYVECRDVDDGEFESGSELVHYAGLRDEES